MSSQYAQSTQEGKESKGSDSQECFAPPESLVARRTWLHIDEHGKAEPVEAVDKHRLVQELSIRYRDLLQLDPAIPTPVPASILIREKALVLNLYLVRCIMCANQCYLLSVPRDDDCGVATAPTLDNSHVQALCHALRAAYESRTALLSLSSLFDYAEMPYELRALEWALDTAIRQLDREVLDLEKTAYPAIDRMASAVSREVLEEVRAAKATMNRLLGRVERLKEQLEGILEDDADMHDMYLGRRAALEGKELPSQHVPTAAFTSRTLNKSMAHLIAMQQAHEDSSGMPGKPAATLVPPPALGPAAAVGGPAAASTAPNAAAATVAAAGGVKGSSKAQRGGEEGQHAADGQSGEQGRLQGKASGGGSNLHLRRHSGLLVRTVRWAKGGRPPRMAGSRRSIQADGDEAVVGASPQSPYSRYAALGNVGDDVSEEGRSSPSEVGSVIEETVMEHPGPLVHPHDIEEVEDLLESVFMQVDYLMRRLMLLKERIDDTEDLVNIEMDHRRNELVALDLIVTIFTAAFGFVAMVGGIFGMNLYNVVIEDSAPAFIAVIVITATGGFSLLAFFFLFIRKRKLLPASMPIFGLWH